MAINNLMPQPQPFVNPQANLVTPMMPGNMAWAKGKNEAMNYPMARGTTLPIFDANEEDIFYLKSVDVYGNTQPLRKFRYEEITEETNSAGTQQPGVTAEEFNSLKDQISILQEEIKKLAEIKSSNQYNDRKPYRKENRNNGQ